MSIDLSKPVLGEASAGLYEQARQLAGLNVAALAVNSALSVNAVMQTICEQAREIIGAHQAVCSLNLNQNWAQAINALSLSDKYAEFRTYDAPPDGSGIYALVCELNRPLRMTQDQLEAHPRWRAFGKEAGRHPALRGWLAAPLKNRSEQNIGLIQASDKFDGEFTQNDEAILVQLAALGSVAIEIRRAHDELENRVAERTSELENVNRELIRQIGERERAEARTRLILQTAPIARLVVATDGNLTLVNDHAEKLFGYEHGELLGKSVDLLVPDWLRDRHKELRDSFFRSPDARNIGLDAQARRKNGAEIPVEILIRPMETPEGLFALVTVIDLTERKKAQAVLRESEAKWRQLAQTCPDSILTLNLDGTIAFINHSTPGYPPPKNLIGTSVYQWLPPEQREPFERAVSRVIATREPTAFEVASMRPDGVQSWWSTRMGPVMLEDRVQAITIVSTEITERRQAEEALARLNVELEDRVQRRTVQLEAANKELEAFGYSVSHDLRAPLRAIDGFGAAILEDCAASLNESGRDHLRRICAASQRMAQLIDDLLKLSRLTRGELRTEPVDLSALAQAIVQELRSADPNRSISINIESRLTTRGDPHLLRQVLQNLLDNAWKFTSHAEQPRIEVGKVNQDSAIVYFVRDNGAGFDMEHADKLFGAFQRLHGMREFPGNGIGHAIVKRILSRHGGKIWAEAAIDRGATFFFTL